MDQNRFGLMVAQVEALDKLHRRFAAHVASMQSQINGGIFISNGSDFQASVLGVTVNVSHRPIIIDGHFDAVEYRFFLIRGDSEQDVFYLYLDDHGTLFKDAKYTNRLCNFDNPHLLTNFLPELASALIAAGVFNPK